MDREDETALELLSELGGKEGEQGHEEKLDRYGKAKTHQRAILAHILSEEPTLSREAEDLESCSQTLVFRHWPSVDVYRLIGGITCKKHLLCPMCGMRRSAKTAYKAHRMIKTLMEKEPNLIPVLITMTIRNDEDLQRGFSLITSSKTKLISHRRDALKPTRKSKTKSVMRFVHGSIGSYEFKLGKNSGDWHPHSHEIAFLDPSVEFIDMVDKKGKKYKCPFKFQTALSKEWHKITCGSDVVDVRMIENLGGENGDEALLKAVCEAFKYALKLSDLEISDRIYAYKVLKRKRLTFSYGSLWGLKVPDDMHDTVEAELALLPYIDLIYGFYDDSYVLEEKTDTGDTLFKIGVKAKKVDTKKKRVRAVVGRFARGKQFEDDVKDYAKVINEEQERAFECFFDAPVTLEQKVLYREHLSVMGVK